MRNSEKPSGLFLPKQLDKEIKTYSLVIVCAHVGVSTTSCQSLFCQAVITKDGDGGGDDDDGDGDGEEGDGGSGDF